MLRRTESTEGQKAILVDEEEEIPDFDAESVVVSRPNNNKSSKL